MDNEAIIRNIAAIYDKPYEVVRERLSRSVFFPSMVYEFALRGEDPLHLCEKKQPKWSDSIDKISRQELKDGKLYCYSGHPERLVEIINPDFEPRSQPCLISNSQYDSIKESILKYGIYPPDITQTIEIAGNQLTAEEVSNAIQRGLDRAKKIMDKKESKEPETKPEPKFKSGDKVRIITDRNFCFTHGGSKEYLSLKSMEGVIIDTCPTIEPEFPFCYDLAIYGKQFHTNDPLDLELVRDPFNHIPFRKDLYDLANEYDAFQDQDKPIKPLLIEWER